MNMRIVLDKKTGKFIADAVAAGRYANAGQLIKDGVALLRARDKGKLAQLQAAVQTGLDAYERGDYVTLEADDIRPFVESLRSSVQRAALARSIKTRRAK